MKNIAYFGIDYHLNTLTIAVMIEGNKDIDKTIRIKNDDKIIKKFINKWSADYEIKACYEASFSGYHFQRKMNDWGYHCDVIAPSLIPKAPGAKRKNDFRDAQNLVRNYASGLLSIVYPPSEVDEAVRSLVRCRLAFKESVKKAKQQINGLLLSQGMNWPGNKWTHAHMKWLLQLQLPHEYLHKVLDEYLEHLAYLESRVQSLDKEIENIAKTETYAPSVTKLRAFKGIGTLTAMLLISEITDFRRFPSPRALMAFLGLVPSENSSGETQRGGPITKAGNTRCRKQLVESVQHYSRKPRISKQMEDTLSQVDAKSSNIAIKCMERLHKRYWALINKGKIRSVALTAIAREFAGFIWAMMRSEPMEQL